MREEEIIYNDRKLRVQVEDNVDPQGYASFDKFGVNLAVGDVFVYLEQNVALERLEMRFGVILHKIKYKVPHYSWFKWIYFYASLRSPSYTAHDSKQQDYIAKYGDLNLYGPLYSTDLIRMNYGIVILDRDRYHGMGLNFFESAEELGFNATSEGS